MVKLVFFILLAVAGWLLFKGLKRPAAPPPAERGADAPERMVRCELCGVYLPESDSMQRDDKRMCRSPDRCLQRQTP